MLQKGNGKFNWPCEFKIWENPPKIFFKHYISIIMILNLSLRLQGDSLKGHTDFKCSNSWVAQIAVLRC